VSLGMEAAARVAAEMVTAETGAKAVAALMEAAAWLGTVAVTVTVATRERAAAAATMVMVVAATTVEVAEVWSAVGWLVEAACLATAAAAAATKKVAVMAAAA